MRYLINDLNALHTTIETLSKFDRISCDTETKGPSDVGGLYPFHGSRAFSVIFATAEDEYYFNFNSGGINPKYIQDLQPIFDKEDRIIFFVNAVFDACILYHSGIKIKSRVVDCPAIARVEYNRHGRQPWVEESFLSMAYLAEYYGVKLKDKRVEEYIKENNLYSEKRSRFTNELIPLYELVPLDLMFEYGCGDARTTFDLGTKIIRCINYKDSIYNEDAKLIDVAKNEIKLTSVLIDMKINGLKIDRNYIQNQIDQGKKELQKLTSEVRALTGEININSGKQLAEFLIKNNVDVPRGEPTETMLLRSKKNFELAEIAKNANNLKKYRIHLEKAIEYKKGNYITDKKTLQDILKKHPELDFLSKITKAKELEKKIGTYFENFLLLADENDILHASLNQEKAITGRFSSTEPNLQNTHKKDTSVKRSFIPYSDEYYILCIDFDQCEMMVMLDQAGELPVIEKLLDGTFDDFYLATAHVLKEVTGLEIDRQTAKGIALGLAYGQGKDLLAANLKMTPDEAMRFKAEFFKALPALKKFELKLKNKVKYYGKIHNPFGRVSYLNKDNEDYKALNSFIQGTSADITKKAMVDIYEFLKPYKSKLVLSIHDECLINIHKDELFLVPELQNLMSKAYKHIHIPLGTGVEYSAISWGDKIKWEQNHLVNI